MSVLRERALFLAVAERNYRNNVVDVGGDDLGKRIVAYFNRLFFSPFRSYASERRDEFDEPAAYDEAVVSNQIL